MIEYIRGELTELTPAMAGMAGFEPAKCQSQSLVPYHLATSQYPEMGGGGRFELPNP